MGAAQVAAATALSRGVRAQSIGNPESREPLTFDYVIVGSGPGGGPLAANLARAPGRPTVLVLEAGSEDLTEEIDAPALFPLASEDERIAWKYYVKFYSDQAKRERNSRLRKDKDGVLYPRAATIGGCSAINALIAMLPGNGDWDQLAKLTGEASYRANVMQPYFRRIECNRYVDRTVPQPRESPHGFEGWVPTEQSSIAQAFSDDMISAIAGATLAHERLDGDVNAAFDFLFGRLDLDPNSWKAISTGAEGAFLPPKTTENGHRGGVRQRLLETRTEFSNLEIWTECLATRVLFADGPGNRANGVAFVPGRGLYKADPRAIESRRFNPADERAVYARREVILAGGAFNSPQLLMLSGIGDPDVLRKAGVAPRVALPGVGRNLQDRYEVGVVHQMDRKFQFLETCATGTENDPCLVGDRRGTIGFRQNALASAYSSNSMILGIKRRSRPSMPDPDLFVFSTPGDLRGFRDGWGKAAPQFDRFTFLVLKGYAQNSTGTVELRSADPFDVPEINFRCFEDGRALEPDLTAMASGVRLAREVTALARGREPAIGREIWPGPAVADDSQIRQFIQDECWGHHASCTNKMGPRGLGPANALDAVVDPDFCVYGVQGLRVVDASVFPKIPGLFISVPIYMMSERASDVIIASASKNETRGAK